MASKNPPDERVVYLALKNVFKGPNAGMRRLPAIRKLIVKNQKQGDITDLVNAHNIDIVCNTARVLLTEKIFESTLAAKIRFPEVFDVSPDESAEREASEVEAARNGSNAIQVVVHGLHDAGRDKLEIRQDVAETVEARHESKTHHVPSLFPTYLPLRSQHRLLVKVQDILEHMCFEFSKRTMPDLLSKNGWDCSEAAELNLWISEFLKRPSDFQGGAGKPVEDLFRSVADIRHASVHRIRVSARGMEQFMLDAESLATLLGDTVRLKSLNALRRSTQSAIEELERNKQVLKSKFAETRKKLAIQRAELDRQEKASIAEMIKEDSEYQEFAGMNLEQAILASEEAPPTASAAGENGVLSEGDIDDISSVAGSESTSFVR